MQRIKLVKILTMLLCLEAQMSYGTSNNDVKQTTAPQQIAHDTNNNNQESCTIADFKRYINNLTQDQIKQYLSGPYNEWKSQQEKLQQQRIANKTKDNNQEGQCPNYTKEDYKCDINEFNPDQIKQYLGNIQAYWKSQRDQLQQQHGDKNYELDFSDWSEAKNLDIHIGKIATYSDLINDYLNEFSQSTDSNQQQHCIKTGFGYWKKLVNVYKTIKSDDQRLTSNQLNYNVISCICKLPTNSNEFRQLHKHYKEHLQTVINNIDSNKKYYTGIYTYLPSNLNTSCSNIHECYWSFRIICIINNISLETLYQMTKDIYQNVGRLTACYQILFNTIRHSKTNEYVLNQIKDSFQHSINSLNSVLILDKAVSDSI